MSRKTVQPDRKRSSLWKLQWMWKRYVPQSTFQAARFSNWEWYKVCNAVLCNTTLLNVWKGNQSQRKSHSSPIFRFLTCIIFHPQVVEYALNAHLQRTLSADVWKVLHPSISRMTFAYVKKVLDWIEQVNIKSYITESHQLTKVNITKLGLCLSSRTDLQWMYQWILWQRWLNLSKMERVSYYEHSKNVYVKRYI